MGWGGGGPRGKVGGDYTVGKYRGPEEIGKNFQNCTNITEIQKAPRGGFSYLDREELGVTSVS